MSGHSKWSNIHRKKEANDKVRSGIFTKLAAGIAMAVNKGGGIANPEMNFTLRLAVDKAKAANMPKENIERAIAKASGKGEGVTIDELTIEGFGPLGKIVFLIEAMSDNRNRSVAEIRTIIEKHGGRMGEMGSVGYMFERVGIINLSRPLTDDESLELIDYGMIEMDGVSKTLFTRPDDLHKCLVLIEQWGIKAEGALIGYRSRNQLELNLDENVTLMLEKIEEHPDVMEVYVAMV